MPAGNMWTPGWAAYNIQTLANQGLTQTEIFQGLIAAGFDSGFALQTIQKINSMAGTSYSAISKGDVDASIYGNTPFVIHVADPTYAFTGAGQLVFPGNNPTTDWYQGAGCGGLGCLYGGTEHYFVVPSEIASAIGTSNLQRDQEVMTALMMGMPIEPNTNYVPAEAGNCNCITLDQYNALVHDLNIMAPLVAAWEQKTGLSLTMGGIPYESGFGTAAAATAGAAFPSPLDVAWDIALHNPTLLATMTAAQATAGGTKGTIIQFVNAKFAPVYAKALLAYVNNYGWTATSQKLALWAGFMEANGISSSDVEAAVANSKSLQQKIAQGDPTVIADMWVANLAYMTSGCDGNCAGADFDASTNPQVAAFVTELKTMTLTQLANQWNLVRQGCVTGAGCNVPASLQSYLLGLGYQAGFAAIPCVSSVGCNGRVQVVTTANAQAFLATIQTYLDYLAGCGSKCVSFQVYVTSNGNPSIPAGIIGPRAKPPTTVHIVLGTKLGPLYDPSSTDTGPTGGTTTGGLPGAGGVVSGGGIDPVHGGTFVLVPMDPSQNPSIQYLAVNTATPASTPIWWQTFVDWVTPHGVFASPFGFGVVVNTYFIALLFAAIALFLINKKLWTGPF